MWDSVNARNAQGVNALFLAVQGQHEDVVQQLLSHSDFCIVEKKSNLTIADLCAPPSPEDEDDDDLAESEAKNAPIRELLLSKCADFSETTTVEVVRVGATTAALRYVYAIFIYSIQQRQKALVNGIANREVCALLYFEYWIGCGPFLLTLQTRVCPVVYLQ